MDTGNAYLAGTRTAAPADAMGKGGTPQDYMSQPSAMAYNGDQQELQRVPVDLSPVDATESLMSEGYTHDMLGVIPQVAGFASGPGDKNPGMPGWT